MSEPHSTRGRFAHISDPHLTTLAGAKTGELLNKRLLAYLSWRRKRRFQHRADVLTALQDDLASCPVAQLVITGDLTHAGLPQEFAQARDWLQQLGAPDQVAVVPGNHDACVKAPWQDTYALWNDYLASDEASTPPFPSLRIRDRIAFIGLSSACPTPPLMATGTLGRAQLDRLPALLDRTREDGLFRVVYLHHSPLPGAEKWRKRLTDAAALHAKIAAHGAELVLYGHGHRTHFDEIDSRHGTVPAVAVPSASAIGLHGAEAAHYNRYAVAETANGWRVEIESRGYDRATHGFTELGRQSLDLIRR